jgi:cyclic pyranopterin phosphate synthase
MAQTIDLIAGKTAIQPPPALLDAFDRTISYLRISVTDRCNLRCVYCMPPAGLPWIAKPDLLSFDEIVRVAMAGAALGLRSIRLTGGEPLLRPRIVDLVRALAAIPGVDDISLSTNGLLLAELAEPLACAGLRRVNVSLDTLRADRFEELALRPGLGRVLAGIEAALAAGLVPLKLNCVVMRGRNHDEIAAFAALTKHQPIAVRFIELMPVEKTSRCRTTRIFPAMKCWSACARSTSSHRSTDPKATVRLATTHFQAQLVRSG